MCVCVSVGVLCCGCFGVGFAPLSCLGAISVVGCWNTGVSNGVHAVLLNNLLASSGHRLSFRMPLGPLIPPLLCTNS